MANQLPLIEPGWLYNSDTVIIISPQTVRMLLKRKKDILQWSWNYDRPFLQMKGKVCRIQWKYHMFIDTFDVEMKICAVYEAKWASNNMMHVYIFKKTILLLLLFWKFWKRDVKKDKKFNDIPFSAENRKKRTWV